MGDLVKEEDKVVDHCNVIIVEYWEIIKEIVHNCKHSVHIVSSSMGEDSPHTKI